MSIFISGGGGAGGGATTLNGLGDVTITSAANGQILQYNSVSGVWENTGLNITGGLTYKGTFNATAGTPSLANAEQGDFYLIDTAGTYEGVVWGVGDHLLINADMGGSVTASKIDKIDNTDAVASVNGQTGVVVLDTDDVAEGAANEYFTDAKADARADVRIAASDLTDLNDVSYTAGPGIDNYVLTYDNTAGTWGAEAAATAPVDSVNGQTGVVVLDTDDVAEGAANEYFTDAKADARADVRIAASDLNALNDVSYTAGPGIDNYVLTYDNTAGTWGAEVAASAPVSSVNGQTGVVVLDTDDVAEGAANEYFTDAKADARIAAADLTDLNDVSYTAGPGIDNYVLTYDNTAGTWGAEAAASGLQNVVEDTSPQLGGNLDVQARIIETSTANGSIGLEPDGTGTVIARGTGAGNTPGTITLNCEENSHGVALQSPPHSAAASYTLKLPTGVGTSGQLLTTDGNNPAQLSWSTVSGGGGSRPVVYSVSTATTIGADTAIASTELERIYVVDTASAVTMTLPQITGNVGNGYKLNIKRDGDNTCTITPNAADNIDGGTDGASITLDVDKASFTLVCDGTNWQII